MDGIIYLSTGHYYEAINQWVAHKLKEGDTDAFDYAARQMAKMLPKNAVLVPIPGRHGTPDQTLKLCRNIASYTHLPILDALRVNERESQYESKYKGRSLTEISQVIAGLPTSPQDKSHISQIMSQIQEPLPKLLLKPLAVVLFCHMQ